MPNGEVILAFTTEEASTSTEPLIVARLDRQGNMIWATKLEGVYSIYPLSLKTASDGKVLVAGFFQQTRSSV